MLESSRPAPELSHFLGFMLKWCGDRSARLAMEMFGEHGLHPREFGLLNILSGAEGQTQQELAERSGIDSSTMVAVVDQLERKGLAERRVAATDRRRRSVHLTKAGHAKLVELRPAVRATIETQFAALTAAEREELLRLLRKLAGYDN